ncbi:MAG: CHAT domain-containing tetratricopeptide repeat protein [Bacteroidota bacterium]
MAIHPEKEIIKLIEEGQLLKAKEHIEEALQKSDSRISTDKAEMYYLLSKVEIRIGVQKAILVLEEAFTNHRYSFKVCSNLCDLYANEFRFKDAIRASKLGLKNGQIQDHGWFKHFQDNLEIEYWKAQGENAKRSLDWIMEAEGLNRSGLFSDASRMYEKAYATEIANLKIPHRLASIQFEAGNNYSACFQNENAITCYEEALAIAKEYRLSELEADIQHNYEVVRMRESKETANEQKEHNQSIISELRDVIHKISEKKKTFGSWIAYNNLGSRAVDAEQFVIARNAYRRSIELLRALPKVTHEEISSLSTSYMGIGAIEFRLGNYEMALDYYEKSREVCHNNRLYFDEVNALIGLSDLYLALGNRDWALEKIKDAWQVEVVQRTSRPQILAGILQRHGTILIGQLDIAAGLGKFEKAIKYLESKNHHSQLADTLSQIGECYQRIENFDQARSAFERAAQINRDLDRVNSLASDLISLASIDVVLAGPEQGAVRSRLQEALELVEQVFEMTEGESRYTYIDLRMRAYVAIAETYLQEGRYAEALSWIEKSKAKGFRKKLEEFYAVDPTDVELSWILKNTKFRSATLYYYGLNSEFPRAVVITNGEVHHVNLNVQGFLERTIKKYEPIISTLNRQKAEKCFSKEEDNSTPHSSNNDVFACLADRLVASKVHNPPQELPFLIQLIDLSRKSVRWDAIQGPKAPVNFRELANELFQLLFPDELLDIIDQCRDLLIVPDYALPYIPFDILIDEEDDYLISKYEIHQVNSISIWKWLVDTKQQRWENDTTENQKFFLGITMPDGVYFSPKVELEDSEFEIQAYSIDTVLKDSITMGEGFSLGGLNSNLVEDYQTNFRSLFGADNHKIILQPDRNQVIDLYRRNLISEYRVIDFMLHGSMCWGFPEFSGLLLDEPEECESFTDFLLRPEDIEKIRFQADFVNLAACETIAGKAFAGEGVVGFEQSLLLSGALSVCLTLWEIPHESSLRFFHSVYGDMFVNRASVATALHTTKKYFAMGRFGREYAHPYYWAGFSQFGI